VLGLLVAGSLKVVCGDGVVAGVAVVVVVGGRVLGEVYRGEGVV